MCTVTFIPLENSDFVLTSNRDEAPNRKTISPEMHDQDATKLLYPKDALAGGTWIGVSDKNRLICLLNGGYKIHERQAEYRMSRGTVVKELLTEDNMVKALKLYNLVNVEPFTLVIVDWTQDLQLLELVWDGEKKHITKLPLQPKLWSSSTLYNESMKQERQDWFATYLKTKALTANSILNFHKTAGDNIHYATIMDRGFVKTTSITQVKKASEVLSMQYHDLQNQQQSEVTFSISETINE